MKAKLTPDELKAFEYYLAGGERGDLSVYARRGRLGIMKPDRSHGYAMAAWLAGQVIARKAGA